MPRLLPDEPPPYDFKGCAAFRSSRQPANWPRAPRSPPAGGGGAGGAGGEPPAAQGRRRRSCRSAGAIATGSGEAPQPGERGAA
jgi:hypothetical protein